MCLLEVPVKSIQCGHLGASICDTESLEHKGQHGLPKIKTWMDDICEEPVSTGDPDDSLVLEKIHVLTLEVGPLLVRVSPLPNVLFCWRWLFGTLFAMQGKRSRLHELEALAAHNAASGVGMKG